MAVTSYGSMPVSAGVLSVPEIHHSSTTQSCESSWADRPLPPMSLWSWLTKSLMLSCSMSGVSLYRQFRSRTFWAITHSWSPTQVVERNRPVVDEWCIALHYVMREFVGEFVSGSPATAIALHYVMREFVSGSPATAYLWGEFAHEVSHAWVVDELCIALHYGMSPIVQSYMICLYDYVINTVSFSIAVPWPWLEICALP